MAATAVLWSSWFASVALVVGLALRRIDRIYWTHWYDLSTEEPLKALEWKQIRELMEKDPLEHQRCCRWSLRWLVLDLTVLAILISLVWFFLELIRDPGRYVVANGIKEFVPSAGVFALVGAALALQVPAVNPLPGNTLYLSEEVQRGLLICITEVLEKQVFG